MFVGHDVRMNTGFAAFWAIWMGIFPAVATWAFVIFAVTFLFFAGPLALRTRIATGFEFI